MSYRMSFFSVPNFILSCSLIALLPQAVQLHHVGHFAGNSRFRVIVDGTLSILRSPVRITIFVFP
jgi:hypothetical protein